MSAAPCVAKTLDFARLRIVSGLKLAGRHDDRLRCLPDVRHRRERYPQRNEVDCIRSALCRSLNDLRACLRPVIGWNQQNSARFRDGPTRVVIAPERSSRGPRTLRLASKSACSGLRSLRSTCLRCRPRQGLWCPGRPALGSAAPMQHRVRSALGSPRSALPARTTSAWLDLSVNSVPTQCSRDRIRRLKAGCVTLRCSAAREKLPHSAKVRKSSIHCSSMPSFLWLIDNVLSRARPLVMRHLC